MTEAFGSKQGIFVADDTGLPKQGKHSVGVAHQYCGALGKNANCQVAASLHYVSPRGHFSLAMRLYLPQEWIDDTPRLDKVGGPPAARTMRTKGQIALELLDLVRAEGVPGRLVVADAGHGVSEAFRDGLAERGLHYVVGVTGEMVVFQSEPVWDDPAPRVPGRWGPRLRSHPPLIEPDGRVSRIRLLDQNSCFRPRTTPRPSTKQHDAKLVVQPHSGRPCRPATLQLVFASHSLAETMPRVAVDCSLSREHRTEDEVTRSAPELPVQLHHSVLRRRRRPDVQPARPR